MNDSEVTTIRTPDDFGNHFVNLHQNTGFFKLPSPIHGHTVEVGRPGIPAAPQIAVHELGLVGQAPQGIAKDGNFLARLHHTQIDSFVVNAQVLLAFRGCCGHKNSPGHAPRRRAAIQVGDRLVNGIGGGGLPIHVCGNDVPPGLGQVSENAGSGLGTARAQIQAITVALPPP